MAETKIFGVKVNTEALSNIPESYKIIAGVVFSIIVFISAGYYLVYPIYDEYSKLYEENQKLADENKQSELKLGFIPPNKYKVLDDIIEEKKTLEADIRKLQERIPSKENTASLIYDLEKMVEVNNKSELYDIVPSQLTKASIPAQLQSGKPTGLDLNQISLAVTIDSNYPNLISLMKDFERYQRAISSTSLSLTPVGSGNKKFNVLKTTLSLRAYVLPEGVK